MANFIFRTDESFFGDVPFYTWVDRRARHSGQTVAKGDLKMDQTIDNKLSFHLFSERRPASGYTSSACELTKFFGTFLVESRNLLRTILGEF